MADFCRSALAYMDRAKLEEYKELKTSEMAKLLLHHLQQEPWLLILDGLERVLVAYNRPDAAELADEKADTPTDEIANRDPCAAIRPEDDDLLRSLAGATKSKVLISSRLVPRILINPSGQAIPGVRREALPGLRPSDAEALLKSCGVTGDSQSIQDFLKTNCDCHPLVTGVLAGLINEYLPEPSNFDAWVKDDAQGGARLNLAELDLIQRRNHILKASLEAVPPSSRRLLSMLSIVSEAVDYQTLALLESKEYNPKELAAAVKDLRRRGLLQYEGNRFDFHPVVRAVAGGMLNPEETERDGRHVVDALSSRPHNPWDNAKIMEDVQDGIYVVRTWLRMGRHQEASRAYGADLSRALVVNLEAYPEVLALLRPFFSNGWNTLPEDIEESEGSYLLNDAAIALSGIGANSEALAATGATLSSALRREAWDDVSIKLSNLSNGLIQLNRLRQADGARLLGLRLAELMNHNELLFSARFDRFHQSVIVGKWEEAQSMWHLLDPMGRNWVRSIYRPGHAEWWYAIARFWRRNLNESHLAAYELAEKGINPLVVRQIHKLRGKWLLEQQEWGLAAGSLNQAVQLTRAARQYDSEAEIYLKLAQFHSGALANPHHEAEQLENAKRVNYLAMAELWLAIGDREKAKTWALEAYRNAWSDGEPFVFRYNLTKSRTLLETLRAEIPNLPTAKYEKFPCEDEVVAAIEKLEKKKGGKPPQ